MNVSFFNFFFFEKNKILLEYIRSCMLGMKELDLIVGSWAKINIPKMSYEECIDYHK
jgi:hypothetical protein